MADSIAAYNWELARSAALRNNIADRAARGQVYRYANMMQELKRQEDIKKNQSMAAFHAKNAGKPLVGGELDRKTGRITWPIVLYEGRFENARLQAEQSLKQKHDQSAVSVAQPNEDLFNAIEQLKSRLEKDKSDFRPNDFYTARSFLERLEKEIESSNQRIASR